MLEGVSPKRLAEKQKERDREMAVDHSQHSRRRCMVMHNRPNFAMPTGRHMAMRIVAGIILALTILAAPASAQVEDKSERQKAAEARAAKERADIEKEYNATIKRTGPTKAGKSDPWGTIRPSGGADTKR
jgi:hypothetical protein